MIHSMLRSFAAPWLTVLFAAAFALPLAGCVTPDPDLGAVHRQNLALHRSYDDGRVPLAGGSGVRAVAAIKRYDTGAVPRPVAGGAGGTQ